MSHERVGMTVTELAFAPQHRELHHAIPDRERLPGPATGADDVRTAIRTL